jgi:predicted O-methyltransferase YrrM
VSEVDHPPAVAGGAGVPEGFLDDPTPLVVDGVEFVLSFGPGSGDRRFALLKTREMLDQYRALADHISGANVVELGIARGGSAAWLALELRPAKLVAVDIVDDRVEALDALIADRGLSDVVRPHYGIDQADRAGLAELVRAELGGASIDVVIDDASHLLTPTRTSFETLFPLVRPGGLYIFEDWPVQHRNADVYAASFGEPVEHEDEFLAAVAAKMRERVPDPATEPLSRLVIELVLAQATWSPAFDGFSVDRHWITVRRGPGSLDPTTFRLRDLYVDHFGLDPSSTRPD